MGVFIPACSSTEPPLISFRSTQLVASQDLIEIDPLAIVTFQVEVPKDTPPGQPILLSILDEVTGLALNITRKEMQKIGDTTYSITLPFPVGANIKYRYARQDTFTAEEHTTDQRPVRYRLYRVDGPGIVHDVVSTWSDGAYSGSTGRIMGRVTNADDGTPIPNLLVAAGGAQTVTASTGDFLLEGLPPGIHNLVFYAFDGAYRPYQQGAVVAAQSTTPADIQLTPSLLVNLIFTATVPDGTLPAVPIRLAGNLVQLGNTFADLSGGMNTLASRMPTLAPLPDGRYALEIELPVGAFIEYKYTLGDGFWNSEYTQNGDFRLRTLTVPDQNSVIEDRIDNWGSSINGGPVLFDLSVPSTTPDYDSVSIQFNPFGWTEPIPMWKLEEDHWVYMLYSPITKQEDFAYRYCRNDQCGRADDSLTPGTNPLGRLLDISVGAQTVNDVVESWFWMQPGVASEMQETPEVKSRPKNFIAGVELLPYFHPSFTPRLPITYKEIDNLQANWVFLSPTWTFTRQNPPVLESVTGIDQSWSDLSYSTEKAQTFELNVAYNPTPNFPADMQDWWSSSPRDFSWWQVWFERYRNFILNFADKAQQEGASGLVLGGEWVSPALPGGKLPDGSPSGVPADVEKRWREIISEIRERYTGTLFWALPSSKDGIKSPPFIEDLDQVYLLWSLPLTEQPHATPQELHVAAGRYLDSEVFLLDISLDMPITIAVAYPAAEGSLLDCIAVVENNDGNSCYNPKYLEPPYQDNPTVILDLEEQSSAYQALLYAINDRDWINGFVSRGFYPPVELHDKSSSIHGKPSQTIIGDWYRQFLPEPLSEE
jgi:hypothetical protein